MSARDDTRAVQIGRGALAGAVAGVLASFAMDRLQAVISRLRSDESGGEPATERVADAVARRLTGHEVVRAAKPVAGQAVHYGLGLALGVAYGVAAEFDPRVTAGFGTAYGMAVALLLDEALVPAIGVGEPPWRASLSTHLYSYASHLVFGAALELTRRPVADGLLS